MRISMNRWKNFLAATIAIMAVAVAAPRAQNLVALPKPTVLPPVSVYSALSAQWWQWIFGIPADINPSLDITGINCAVHQSGPVWFLAGTFTGGPVVRNCTVPADKALFFPLVNTFDLFDPTETGTPLDDVRALVAPLINGVVTLQATLDSADVKDLFGYRVASRGFTYVLPENNLATALFGAVFPDGYPAKKYGPTTSDGYWLLVAPLSLGKHTIHFGGTVDLPNVHFTTDVTYNLTVVRAR